MGSVPAHHRCGNLVGNKVSENSGMARARSSSRSNLLSDLANCSFLMQKRIVAFPLQPNHDAQVASMGNVQKPAWRGCVRAGGIYATPASGHFPRLEEHKTELQSQLHFVSRLSLEKKKIKH